MTKICPHPCYAQVGACSHGDSCCVGSSGCQHILAGKGTLPRSPFLPTSASFPKTAYSTEYRGHPSLPPSRVAAPATWVRGGPGLCWARQDLQAAPYLVAGLVHAGCGALAQQVFCVPQVVGCALHFLFGKAACWGPRRLVTLACSQAYSKPRHRQGGRELGNTGRLSNFSKKQHSTAQRCRRALCLSLP